MAKKYLPIEFTDTERMDIVDLAKANPSFYEVWQNKTDITYTIFNELKEILYGKIPRNFVINIKGNIGRQTGIFKTSFGCQIALKLDKKFDIEKRTAFTYNQLLEKIKKYADKKQIFLLDEQIRDLRFSGEMRLANIIESCRERQLCFVLVGVPEAHFTFSDYVFERLGESSDEHMKDIVEVNGEKMITGRKTILYLVKKNTENKSFYRGYVKWNVTSLKNKKWNEFWSDYMIDKRAHQQRAIESSLTGFDFKKEADKLRNTEEFKDCVRIVDGERKVTRGRVKNLVYEKYTDITKEERDLIYRELIYSP